VIRATPAHAAALALIHAAAFSRGDAWGADAMALQLELPGAFGFIAPLGGLVLARTVVDEAEILTLAVMPACRGSGIGRALLTQASVHAAERGARVLLLEVSTQNTPARALYCSAGFTEAGRRRGYYRDGSDALMLRRTLSSAAETTP